MGDNKPSLVGADGQPLNNSSAESKNRVLRILTSNNATSIVAWLALAGAFVGGIDDINSTVRRWFGYEKQFKIVSSDVFTDEISTFLDVILLNNTDETVILHGANFDYTFDEPTGSKRVVGGTGGKELDGEYDVALKPQNDSTRVPLVHEIEPRTSEFLRFRFTEKFRFVFAADLQNGDTTYKWSVSPSFISSAKTLAADSFEIVSERPQAP